MFRKFLNAIIHQLIEKYEKKTFLEDKEIRELQDETEYNTLRFEIAQSINRGFTTINLAFSATVIILGYNISLKPHPSLYIFFAPQIILALAIIQIIQGHYSIIQNAVYIKILIENQKIENAR